MQLTTKYKVAANRSAARQLRNCTQRIGSLMEEDFLDTTP
jgi:hypothetical protein